MKDYEIIIKYLDVLDFPVFSDDASFLGVRQEISFYVMAETGKN